MDFDTHSGIETILFVVTGTLALLSPDGVYITKAAYEYVRTQRMQTLKHRHCLDVSDSGEEGF
mgnify:CR=1 FL=1